MGDLPGGLLLQGRQTINEDHAVAPLGDGLPQHQLQAALAGPAGGQHQLQGGGARPGLTGHEEGMPAVAVAALIPETEGNAVLQHIPNGDPWRELKRTQGHGLHRWRGEQGRWRRVLGEPLAQEGQLGTAADGHHALQIFKAAVVAATAGETGLQQLFEGVSEAALQQKRVEFAARQAEHMLLLIHRQLHQGLAFGQGGVAQPAFEPFGSIEQGGAGGLTRATAVHNPAIDVTAPEAQPCLAQNLCCAQHLAAVVPEAAPPQPQQLGDRCGTTFPSFQSHQGQIQGASAQVHHQQSGTSGKPCTHGGCCGFIHQGDLGHRQRGAGLQQPAAIRPIALHRGGQHQPLHREIAGEPAPDLLKQLFSCPAGCFLLWGIRLTDAAFEVAMQTAVNGVIEA